MSSACMNSAWARFSKGSGKRATPGGAEPVVQHGAGGRPVAVHGAARQAQDLRGLLERAPAEEPEFDHPRLTLVEGGKVLESLVECEQVVIGTRGRDLVIDGDALSGPAA